MKQTGEILRSAREVKKLSLHEIGMSLKINPKTLQAIEEGDVGKLPQRTFLRGFVKSYAQYLKLDVPATMQNFDREMLGESPILVSAVANPENQNLSAIEKATVIAPVSMAKASSKLSERAPSHIDRSKAAQTQKMIFFLVGLLLIVFIVLVAKLVNKYQKERGGAHLKAEIAKVQSPEVPVDPNAIVTPTDPAKSELPVEPNAASAAVLNSAVGTAPVVEEKVGDGAPVTVATPAPVTAPVTAPPPVSVSVPAAAPAPAPVVAPSVPVKPAVKEKVVAADKPSETDKPVKAEKPAKAEKVAANEASPGKPQEVILEATGKVTVKYQLDGGAEETVEMSVDDMHTFRSKSNMVLEVSDGGNVNVIVNGRFRGNPSASGTPAKLRYPK